MRSFLFSHLNTKWSLWDGSAQPLSRYRRPHRMAVSILNRLMCYAWKHPFVLHMPLWLTYHVRDGATNRPGTLMSTLPGFDSVASA
ncbi:hypothetical protein A0H81_13083 [Grifola frondosa]|uniref:Uncharacterized protein n=1 Tax=Grifola frondosa TaxID=5627 RepID=A0A1C7LSE0_GRIFR|nr:hypothetical protein A0H81_13083 [Grifola frondosa]